MATSPANYTIRPATPSDYTSIASITANASQKTAAIPELAFISQAVRTTPEKYANWLSSGKVYTAENSTTHDLDGFISWTTMDGIPDISTLAVKLELNRRGIGEMLLRYVLEEAKSDAKGKGKAGARVSLFTYSQVPWQSRWYQKFGFREVDPREVGVEHVERLRYDVGLRDMNREGYTRCCMLWDEGKEE